MTVTHDDARALETTIALAARVSVGTTSARRDLARTPLANFKQLSQLSPLRASRRTAMDFALSQTNLRAFHKSIGFLSRIGPELLVDAHAGEKIKLKTVNAARSAFACVTVHASAFDRFDVRVNGGNVQVCVLAKHAMSSLRSAKMERVECASNASGDAFTVKASCARSGLTKTYTMHTMCDAEYVDADFDGETMGVKLVLRAKVLNRLLAHFASAAQDDVTITCGADVEGAAAADGKLVTLSSYTNPAGGLSQALQTNISLKRDDDSILHYKNATGRDVEVTVNLKDLRCVVHLCESSDVDVAIHCEQTGAPVVVKPTADFKMFQQRDGLGNAADAPVVSFHAMLVLSSMPPKAAAAPSQAPPPREMPPPRPQSLPNAPLGSQPWSAVPDSEDATQRDVGAEVAGPTERPWGADSTIPNDDDADDWLGANDDEYVEATPPEKRQKM